MEQEIQQLKKEITELKEELNKLRANSTIPYDVEQAFRARLADITDLPNGFENAPLTAITAPSGGTTIDSQARTAINSIITALENLGLVSAN